MAPTRTVVAGVDTHADTHHAAVIDQRGRLLDTAQFPATATGDQQLLTWMRGLGQPSRVGVEGTGSYGAGLTRYLNTEGITVVEVNPTNPGTRRQRGKSDPIDAEAAARAVLSGEATATPKDRTGVLEAIRVLRVARAGAVKARTAALNQLKDLITTAPDEPRTQLRGHRLIQATKTRARMRPGHHPPRRPGPGHQNRTTDHRRPGRHADRRDHHSRQAAQGPTHPRRAPHDGPARGCHRTRRATSRHRRAELHPATQRSLLRRPLRASPIPASSGKTTRYRLNRDDDRAANRTLHMIAVVRMRWCPNTRAYLQRRTGEGMSKKDIIRCLKRYIARAAYTAIQHDLAHLTKQTPTGA